MFLSIDTKMYMGNWLRCVHCRSLKLDEINPVSHCLSQVTADLSGRIRTEIDL